MRFRFLLAVFLSISFASIGTGKIAKEMVKPNVLFIAIDDLKVQLGCYGDPIAITPNIDRLASRGLRFDRAYSQLAVCNPSRQSLLTGRRPDTLRVWDQSTHFRQTLPSTVTLPQYFKQQGYHAQAFGKIWHGLAIMSDPASWSVPQQFHEVRPPGAKRKAAVDDDVPDNAYGDGQLADAAVAALRQIADRPFFLAVGFRKPHLPFTAPKRYWDLYNRSKIPAVANPHPPSGAPEIALHDWRELRGYRDIPAGGPLPQEQIAELHHGYYACISYIDAQVGKLLEELDRLELTDRTIVVLWSDHGFHLGEGNLWGKVTNYEIGTRVPLIIATPGYAKAGSATQALVELVDLYPTLVDLAELPMPPELEGVSLRPLLRDPSASVKPAAYSQIPRPWIVKDERESMGYAVRTARFRYVEWRDWSSGHLLGRELYDHETDPSETVNVVDRPRHSRDVEGLAHLLAKNFDLRAKEE